MMIINIYVYIYSSARYSIDLSYPFFFCSGGDREFHTKFSARKYSPPPLLNAGLTSDTRKESYCGCCQSAPANNCNNTLDSSVLFDRSTKENTKMIDRGKNKEYKRTKKTVKGCTSHRTKTLVPKSCFIFPFFGV